MEFYNQTKQEVLRELHSSENGLSEQESQRKLEKYGKNILKKTERLSIAKIFVSQFTDLLIIILIVAAVISFLLNHYLDAGVIAAILVLNAVLGFVQEFKAERSLAMLKKLSALKSRILRAGKIMLIDSGEIVPGDILLLETGDNISADARLIESIGLQTNESTLTGESTPVAKHVKPLPGKVQLADRHNMVFRGTAVTAGRGKAIITETGMNSALGKIAGLVQEAEVEKTPLEMRLRHLGVIIGVVVVIISLIILGVGLLEKIDFITAFLTAVSLAVSAIPEGLPAVVTICLAIGVQRMLKKKALVRKLRAVETLGSTQIICADKTGTMTKNEMEVKKIFVNNKIVDVKDKLDKLILDIGASCNNSELPNFGDPTELALLKIAEKSGVQKREERIHEVPFSSERKYMLTTHVINGDEISYIKGASEKVLELCDYIDLDGRVRKLTSEDRKRILKENEKMAGDALRVLAMAYKKNKETIFVGLVGMIDPPRKEVKGAIELCEKAGIRVVMITGDHKLTAQAIAKQVGINGEAVTGEQLERMSNKELVKIVDKINIYARVDPVHKVRILEALQSKGYVVAMTGDGVNDAPALKKANVGVAMNVKGTDVARTASDMVLLDDNFATIVSAVKEGRVIYSNIKKFVKFLLSANIDEICVILFSLIVGLPLPFLPLQILWLNLITDGLPAIALSVDPAAKGIMEKKPRSKKESILYGTKGFIITAGIIGSIVSIILFLLYYQIDLDKARTMAITTAIFYELFLVFTCRSDTVPWYKLKKNKYLISAVVVSIALQLGLMYSPLGVLFKMVPLAFADWWKIILLSSAGFVFFETKKIIRRFYVGS